MFYGKKLGFTVLMIYVNWTLSKYFFTNIKEVLTIELTSIVKVW